LEEDSTSPPKMICIENCHWNDTISLISRMWEIQMPKRIINMLPAHQLTESHCKKNKLALNT